MGDSERAYWNDIANRDRQRFEREKAGYNGPWKVPDVKDPNAPKKPMSAFLAFGNERRKAIAEANPTLSNTEISHLLSKLWRECPDHIKQHYRDREAREREEFKKIRAEWERQKKERENRESSPSSEVLFPSMAGSSSQDQERIRGGAAFSLPSMASPVMAVAPNQVPIVHPISAFPPGKVHDFAAVQHPFFHQQTGDIQAVAENNNMTTMVPNNMKLPPMNSCFQMASEGITTGQEHFGALRRLSDFSSLDPTPMRPFQMQLPHMQLASSMQAAATTTTTPTNETTVAAEAEITIEDAEDLLGEEREDDNNLGGNPSNIQENAQLYPQLPQPQNMPMARPFIPTFPSPAVQQLQQQAPYNPSHMPSIEQMLDNMSQHHSTAPVQLQNASLFGGDTSGTAETQRMAELARELGDDAVSMLIGTFR